MGRSMPIQILGGQRQAAVAAAVGLAVVTFHTTLFLGDDDDGRSDFGPLCPGPPLLSLAFRLLTQLLIALLGTPVFQEWRIFPSSPTLLHETLLEIHLPPLRPQTSGEHASQILIAHTR